MNPETNDPLDALLGEQSCYIEDKGFTARVVSALPKPRRRTWLRPLILLSATGIGYILAILWLPWHSIVAALASPSLNSQTLLSCVVLLCIGGSLLWGLFSAIGSEEL